MSVEMQVDAYRVAITRDDARNMLLVSISGGALIAMSAPKSIEFNVFWVTNSQYGHIINRCADCGFTPQETYAIAQRIEGYRHGVAMEPRTPGFTLGDCRGHMVAYLQRKAEEMRQAAELAEKKKFIDLLVGENPTAAVPSFAAVAQPAYLWKEIAHLDGSGTTGIPTPGTDEKLATIVYPFGDTPWARAVKMHELLHARFTPEIMPLMVNNGEGVQYQDVVRQIAEDIRLANIARAKGLLRDDTFFPEAAWNVKPDKPRSDLDKAVVMMANWGQPLEGDWNKLDVAEYMGRLGGVQPHAKGVLEIWKDEVQDILDNEPNPQRQFLALAKSTHNALVVLAEPPPPGGGGQQQQKQDSPSRGDDKSDEDSGSAQESQSGGISDGEQDTESEDRPEQKERPQPQNQSQAAQRRRKAVQKQHEKRRQEIRYAREKSIPRELRPSVRESIQKSAGCSKASLRKSIPESLLKEIMGRIEESKRAGHTPDAMNDTRGYGNTNAPWTPGGLRPPPPTKEIAENYSLDATENIWGDMTIQLAPLERNFKALVKRPGTAAPEGPSPRHLHRWYGDKQLFVRQGLRRGGALLIDISGSMGWAWKDTLALIEATPAMIIALYSGWADHGHLTIIAKDGRLVSPHFSPKDMGHGGSNTVDGPALAWLARQPRPRVWFSDGQVHGSSQRTINYTNRTGLSASSVLSADVKRLTRLGAIHRTVEVDDVKKIFMGMKVGERE